MLKLNKKSFTAGWHIIVLGALLLIAAVFAAILIWGSKGYMANLLSNMIT